MKRLALIGAFSALVALPLAAQQPAPRDTAQRGTMMGHRMPAQAGQHPMPGVQGGMMGHDSMMMHGMMGGMMSDSGMAGMMGAMMAGMSSSPEHLLAQKAALHLTADQERRITAIRDAARPAHDAAMRNGAPHARELQQALQAATPDTAAVRQHFQAAFAAMEQAHLTMLEAAAQARAVLTDAQRRQVDAEHARMARPQGQAPAPRR